MELMTDQANQTHMKVWPMNRLLAGAMTNSDSIVTFAFARRIITITFVNMICAFALVQRIISFTFGHVICAVALDPRIVTVNVTFDSMIISHAETVTESFQ
jgi:uncharacterized membrane protein YfbV (UPF0208 family)